LVTPSQSEINAFYRFFVICEAYQNLCRYLCPQGVLRKSNYLHLWAHIFRL